MAMAFIWVPLGNLALGQTQETPKAPAKTAVKAVDFAPELDAVTAQLKTKFEGGKTNLTDLQENLTAINALILKHVKDGKREQVARLYLLDAHIYADGLNDKNRAQAIWEQVLRDFPGTLAAQGAKLALIQNIPEGLDLGQRFPDFNEAGLSVSACLGRVTLVDFWATWCGPCRGEMPNVIAAYQSYHGRGFEIIGVSLDDDRDALVNFTRAQGIAWPQYFDGQGWQNKLALRYGVASIPANYLLNRHGVIIGKNLRGDMLIEAVAKAVAGN
jgi:thiol-disulfide isomerase/thioredoxin